MPAPPRTPGPLNQSLVRHPAVTTWETECETPKLTSIFCELQVSLGPQLGMGGPNTKSQRSKQSTLLPSPPPVTEETRGRRGKHRQGGSNLSFQLPAQRKSGTANLGGSGAVGMRAQFGASPFVTASLLAILMMAYLISQRKTSPGKEVERS